MGYKLSEDSIIITPKGDFNLHKVLHYKKIVEKYHDKKIVFDLSFTRNINSEGIKFIFSKKDKCKIINSPDIFMKCLKILDLNLSSV